MRARDRQTEMGKERGRERERERERWDKRGEGGVGRDRD